MSALSTQFAGVMWTESDVNNSATIHPQLSGMTRSHSTSQSDSRLASASSLSYSMQAYVLPSHVVMSY